MECFTADFLQFFTKKRQNLPFVWAAGYFHQTQAFQELARELVHSFSGDENK